MEIGLVITGLIAFLLFIGVVSGLNVLQEYERGVVFRLGRVLRDPKGPGLRLIIPYGIDRLVKVNMQTVTLDIQPQDVITRDNVTVRVDAVVYYRVVDPRRAIVSIRDYGRATGQVAQTTLRAVIGKVNLDELLGQRDQINDELARVLDDLTDPWGIKVELVEIKAVDLPESMQRAMAAEAQAERERRARIIAAEGEFESSRRLAQAADVMGRTPNALQLRFLQTIGTVASERNSTLVLPVPVELLSFFARSGGDAGLTGSPDGGTTQEVTQPQQVANGAEAQLPAPDAAPPASGETVAETAPDGAQERSPDGEQVVAEGRTGGNARGARRRGAAG